VFEDLPVAAGLIFDPIINQYLFIIDSKLELPVDKYRLA
jgi:hypothetical protein